MAHYSDAVRTASDIQVDSRQGPGRPKLTWKKLTENDCCEWKLMAVELDPQERSTWRSSVRSGTYMVCVYSSFLFKKSKIAKNDTAKLKKKPLTFALLAADYCCVYNLCSLNK